MTHEEKKLVIPDELFEKYIHPGKVELAGLKGMNKECGIDREVLVLEYCQRVAEPWEHHPVIEIRQLNQYWENLRHSYHSLRLRGYYLPKLKTKAVTGKYLYGILKGFVYCPMSDQVQRAFLPMKVSKADLCEDLCRGMQMCGFEGKKKLGWTEDTYPDT
jgi:hypothetical protein